MQATTEYLLGDACRHWLRLGFDLVPIQPKTKYIVKGFGIHQRRIKSIEDATSEIIEPRNNLAVVCNDNNFVIDFDDWNIYAAWLKSTDEIYTTSYTEFTRRGAHVFLRGDVVQGLTLIDGVEIKRIAIVAPSNVQGYLYERGDMEIYCGDVDRCFFSLSRPGTPTAHLLRTREISPAKPNKQIESRGPTSGGKIERIKSTLEIEKIFSTLSPTKKTIRGGGRYKTAVCPFHKGGSEKKPSFWIDTEKGIYGCHACNERGDVINLYAAFTGRTVSEAIQALSVEVAR